MIRELLLSCLVGSTAFAQNKLVTTELNSGLLPVEQSARTGKSASELFNTQTVLPIGNQKNDSAGSASTGGSSSSGSGVRVFKESAVTNPEFRCDLFANSDYATILSAVTTLNQAVSAANCSGSTADTSSVSKNGKTITDSISAIKPILESGSSMTAEQGNQVVTSVDSAIKAATSIATTFANSDLFKKECKSQMSSGDVALAINNIINGLTPYAISAASIAGGSVAIPFIVGGSAITGVISSLNKIVTQNEVNISDSQVRRAVLENTCQYIKIEQKYKYLLKNRSEQIGKINSEITAGQNQIKQLYAQLSPQTASLIQQKNDFVQQINQIRIASAAAQTQFNLDKDFIASTSDTLKTCQLGLQLLNLSNSSSSYFNQILRSMNSAAEAYGGSNPTQVLTLNNSAQVALKSLNQISNTTVTLDFNYDQCAKITNSLLDTLDKSLSTTTKLLALAEDGLETNLEKVDEYKDLKKQQNILAQKQKLANNLTGSLDNLRQYANAFSQSEIDSELSKVRTGLFAQGTLGADSPVKSWLDYTETLHQNTLKQFYSGIKSLQTRAFKLTKSGSTVGGQKTTLDNTLGENIATFTSEYLTTGSKAYKDTCRELVDVAGQWQSSVNHLVAYESLCSMIDNNIFDNRKEDKTIIQACRGTAASLGVGTNSSELSKLKDRLIADKALNWAILIKKRITTLGCQN